MGSPGGSEIAESLSAEDPRQVGNYRLIGRLGAGGMGQVFLGRSPGGRMVAVKVVHAVLARDPEFRTRFRREVQAARTVSGAFTAPLIDADADAASPWLVTSYIAGPSLQQAVSGHGPLPAATVMALAAGLAEALVAIHEAGVIHRDLKPSNVLLAADGPRVIDFGIARAADASTVTHTGFVIGSPGFMSPEQVTAGETGPAGDVFALGAVLTYAATGQSPFGQGPSHTLMYRVVHAPPDLSGIADQGLRALITACLSKDPALRPAPGQILAQAAGQAEDGITALFGNGWLPAAVAGPAAAQPNAGVRPETSAPSRQAGATVIADPPLTHEPTAPASAARTGTPAPSTITSAAPPAGPPSALHPPPSSAAAPGARRGPARRALLIAGPAAAVAAAAGIPLGIEATRGAHSAPPDPHLLVTFTIADQTGVGAVAISPDGRTVAGGSEFANAVYLGDVATRQINKTLTGHAGAIDVVAFSPDGRTLASGSSTENGHSGDPTRLWDMATGRLAAALPASTKGVISLGFSPDGRVLAVGTDAAVTLWDVATRQSVRTLPGHGPAAFSPDGRTMASIGYAANSVILSAIAAGGISATLPVTGPPPSIGTPPRKRPEATGVAFGADDSVLAVLLYNGFYGTVDLWNTKTRSRIRSLTAIRTGEAPGSIAFSPDGRTLATVGFGVSDYTIRLWDVASGKPGLVLRGHTNSVEAVAFGPGGRTLGSGSLDGTIRLWRVSLSGTGRVWLGARRGRALGGPVEGHLGSSTPSTTSW